jgi:uncharacterized protein (TIGR00369 family)
MEELREGYARVSLTLERRHTNPNGVMHGGVITTMMDSALGAALGALRGEAAGRDPHATVEMNASFLSGARPGDRIVVEGRVIRMGKTIAFGEAEARRNGDTLIAKGRLTFAIRERGQ